MENDGIVDIFVIVGSVVLVIGWARRLERVVFADEAVVVTGRKLIEVGVVVCAGGINEIGAGDVKVWAVVVDGVANEKAGVAVVEAAAAVVVVANVNDGIV